MSLLDESDDLQKKTIETIDNINSKLINIIDLGTASLKELERNTEQMDDIIDETHIIDEKLSITKSLQRKFDMLNGNIFNISFGKKSLEKQTNKKIKEKEKIKENQKQKQNIFNFHKSKKVENGLSEDENNRLEKIYKNDKIIDNSIDNISNSLDAILNMSNNINDELKYQNKKINIIEQNMEHNVNKQSNINNHLKKQLS